MVFTPLLASTTVGTLEARSVALHITTIQKALHQPQNQYVQVGEGAKSSSASDDADGMFTAAQAGVAGA